MHKAADSESSSILPDVGTRRGPSKSCTECRRKKIRCDTARPICGQCLAGCSTCRYVDAKRTGLPRGYVRELENKISQLQQEKTLLEEKVRQGATRMRSPDESLPNDDGLSNTGVARPTCSLPSAHPHGILMQDPFEVAVDFLQTRLAAERQAELRCLFFERCSPFVPIIHETGYAFTDDNVHVKLAIFALASRHHKSLADMSETLYSLAKQTTSSTLNTPSMNTLIAMTLLAVYEIGQPNAALNALTTLSSALALMGAFQLDRMDQPNFSFTCLWLSKPKNWVVEEGRRRVAWMIVCLARWAAAITGRDFGISTRLDIQMLLPVSDKVWNAADNERPHTGLIHEFDHHNELGPFARFIKVQHFFGLVHDLKQSLHTQDQHGDSYGERTAELYSQIQRFIQSFPSDWDKGLSVHDERMLDPTTLCMAHCACLLLDGLHEISLSKEYQHSSCERSTLHAEELLDIAHTIQDQSHLGNFMLPHCWLLAARFRLPELVRKKGHYRGRDTDLLIKCLLTFGTCWGLQDKMMNHVASIQSSTMMFGTPLTTFDPETPDKPPLPPRQPTPVLMPGEDINMPSGSGSGSGSVRDQMADHTGLLRGLDENFAMDDLVVPDCHALDDSVFGSIVQWSIASWGPDKAIELMDL